MRQPRCGQVPIRSSSTDGVIATLEPAVSPPVCSQLCSAEEDFYVPEHSILFLTERLAVALPQPPPDLLTSDPDSGRASPAARIGGWIASTRDHAA